MENYNQKLLHSFSKKKNRYISNNSLKKVSINHYKPIKKKAIFSKKFSLNKILLKKIRLNIQINKKISKSNSQKRNSNINHNLSDYKYTSHKKNLSLNNESNYQISRFKNKFFCNYNKDLNLKKAHKNKNINYSLTNCNLIKNKLCQKIKNENIKTNEKNFFYYNTNYNNYINNTNLFPLKIKNQEKKIKLNYLTTNVNSLIYQRNKSLSKLNTFNNLEIISEGNNNSIENHHNNINIHCIKNTSKLSEINLKFKKYNKDNLSNKKMKKNKKNSSMVLTSINNNNFTNIINFPLSKKKYSKKKKKKQKIKNKILNEKLIKDKLNKLIINLEKSIDEKSSKSKKYTIIKDKFDESINIMRLNIDEKKFLKLIMNKYNDVVSSYSKENKILKNESKKYQNLNSILDKKYIDLENKYNQNMKLIKHFDKNENNDFYNNLYMNNK